MTWIHVTERLPDDDQLVLVTVMDEDESVVWLGYREAGYWWCEGKVIDEKEVIAWMPLPEPAKETST
jgi:hypothetical protein